MRAVPALALVLVLCAAGPVAASPPVVAVWYRGQPAGSPQQDDLAAIRARGFTGVTWPVRYATALPELHRLAAIVGLRVVVQAERPTGISMSHGDRLNIQTSGLAPDHLEAIVWSRIAEGARIVSFDTGASAGANFLFGGDPDADWVTPAVRLSRQLSANAPLFDELGAGLTLPDLARRTASLAVRLLEGTRSWLVVATNTGRARAQSTVRLPVQVPYALWVSLLDGSTMAMLSEAAGPRWTVTLGPGGVQLYVIDKVALSRP